MSAEIFYLQLGLPASGSSQVFSNELLKYK